MTFMEEKTKLVNQVKQIGKQLIELSKNRRSFGSFFLPYESEEVMTYLPYFQQAIWGCPMNEEKTIFWEYHRNLSEIDNYDFKLIFIYEEANENNIILRESNRFSNAYEIVMQMSEKWVGSSMSIVIQNIMCENPYL
jgi:hypothetical protein